MEFSTSQRKAVTKMIAIRCVHAGRGAKKVILDELCATTGWYRDHARGALRQALVLRTVRASRRPRVNGQFVLPVGGQ